jgi:hypothetical protein
MPVIVLCPYCRQGKVRAPNSAIGRGTTCPKCGSHFTIAPDTFMPPAPAAVVAAASGRASDGAARTPLESHADTPVAAMADPMPVVVTTFTEPEESGPDPALVPALIAITLAGVGLALSQVPYGRFATAGLTGIGFVFGLVSLALVDRKRLIPGLATGVNAAALVMAILLPGWLGLSSWLPVRAPDDARTVRAIGLDDGVGAPAEWVDAQKSAWQRDDVRVTITSHTIGPVELIGPKEQRRWTKEKFVQVRVRVDNVGVARSFDVKGWTASGELAARLTDGAGKALAVKTFADGWEPPGRPTAATLFPGRSFEQLLIFETPANVAGQMRLELPGAAFGGTDSVRLLIPTSGP